MQVLDLSHDNYFSMLSDDGNTRDDLKLTENCTPNTPEAIHDLLKQAEADGGRLVVSNLHFIVLFETIFSLADSVSKLKHPSAR